MAITTIEIAISGSGLDEATRKKLEEGIYELQQWVANRIYQISQETVPVATGNLKSTGQVTDDGGVPAIVYTADYAGVVENGIPGTNREGVFFLEDATDMVLSELESVMPDFIPAGLTISPLQIELSS